MAKSLRSKPKLRAKSVKRKGEFAKLNDARTARIAEKLKANLEKQKEDNMEEAVETKNVNTSGWRSSSRRRMKQKRSKKNATKF